MKALVESLKAIWRWRHERDGLLQLAIQDHAFSASDVLLLEAVEFCVQEGRQPEQRLAWQEFARYLIITNLFDLRVALRQVCPTQEDGSQRLIKMHERALEGFRFAHRSFRSTFASGIVLDDATRSDYTLAVALGPVLGGLRAAIRRLPEDVQSQVDALRCEAHRRRVLTGRKYENEGKLDDALHPQAFFGLAMSGGGIRSASFSIGVLQALAKSFLLPSFHYVSSVSGGGYAASWLIAWAYRHQDGLDGVARELSSDQGAESGPLRWVRRHSSYLAPKLSLAATSDVPALVAGYIFNWLPIFFFICLSLGTVLLVPHWIEFRSEVMALASPSDQKLALEVCLASLAAFIGIVRRLTMFCRDATPTTRYPFGLPPIVVGASALIAIVLSTTIPTLMPKIATLDLATYQVPWVGLRLGVFGVLFSVWIGVYVIALAIAAALASRLFQLIWDGLREWGLGIEMPSEGKLRSLSPRWWIFVLGFVASPLVAAACTYAVASLPMPESIDRYVVVLGPIIVLSILCAAEFANALIAHRDMNDVHRAWSARVGGWMASGVGIWIGVSACALLVDDAWREIGSLTWPVRALLLFMLVGTCGVAWRRKITSVSFLVLALLFVVMFSESVVSPLLAGVKHAWSMSPGRMLVIAIVATFFVGRLIDVNRFSLHSLYRDGLVRTFLGASRRGPRNKTVGHPASFDSEENVLEARQFQARRADAIVNLDEDDNPSLYWLRTHPDRKLPLLLLNAAVNGRSPGDFDGRVPRQWPYTFSSYFCGSPASGIGYSPSEDVFSRSERRITLGTAMAVSGAAVSPTAGRVTHPVKAMLLGLLNARLGLWIGNPSKPATVSHESPALTGWAVLTEVLGIRSRFGDWIHLSDGGHFENLGVYELLRRGCSRIVVIDGSCDPEYHMSDLANAIRRARIDLGIVVRHGVESDFRQAVTDGAENLPQQPTPEVFTAVDGEEQRWRWFTIEYGKGLPLGRLLYIKPTLAEASKLPVEVSQYSKSSDSFPHETTADQFFSEAQMEAYRSLGQACGTDAMNATVWMRSLGSRQFDLGLLAAVLRTQKRAGA